MQRNAEQCNAAVLEPEKLDESKEVADGAKRGGGGGGRAAKQMSDESAKDQRLYCTEARCASKVCAKVQSCAYHPEAHDVAITVVSRRALLWQVAKSSFCCIGQCR